MIRKLYRRIRLAFNPLRKGDVLMGDCSDFGIHGLVEQIMHQLRDVGMQPHFSVWSGGDTYKLTVTNRSMPYYILEAEVLTRAMDEAGNFIWMPRTQPRRIDKSKINAMIASGELRRLT